MLLLLLVLTDTMPKTNWNVTDSRMAAIASTMIVEDFITTSAINFQGNSVEYNPLLGRHPSEFKLAGACAISIGAVWTLPRLIHNKTVRRVVLAGVIGVESWTVTRNVAVIFNLSVPHKGHWL